MGILSFLFASKELDAQFKSVYDFKVESLDGGTIDLSKYKGKKILIVKNQEKMQILKLFANEIMVLHFQWLQKFQ